MSEMMNNDLEQKAAAALARVKTAQVESPNIAPQPDDTIAPPPSEEEMSKLGAATSTEIDKSVAADPDEETIFAGSSAVTAPITEDDESVILTSTAKAQLGDMPAADQDAFLSSLMPEIAQYKKQLILEQGMTPAEANIAAQNRAKNKAADAKKTWDEEHPEGVVVTIDKSQEDKVEFTDEERQKMVVSKALKLVVIESQELETIKVKPSSDTIAMTELRDICGSLSQYSVPLLEYGEYATFAGAQTGALANAITNEDDDMLDIIEKKASLLYKYFVRGTVNSRTVVEGSKTRDMTYEEFCNWYKYDDMDMGVYAIVTASAMEVSESTYKCRNEECQKMFNVTYNNKSLLDLSGIPDEFKHRLEDVDAARSSADKMRTLHERYSHGTRVKSPVSKNIYDISSCSIADARNRVEKCMDQLDGTNLIDLLLLLYIECIYVYDPATDDYVPKSVREHPSEAFDVICHIHQVDLELLYKFISEHKYTPSFKIKVKCPHCGRESVDPMNVDDMIFLHARASLTEIQ